MKNAGGNVMDDLLLSFTSIRLLSPVSITDRPQNYVPEIAYSDRDAVGSLKLGCVNPISRIIP